MRLELTEEDFRDRPESRSGRYDILARETGLTIVASDHEWALSEQGLLQQIQQGARIPDDQGSEREPAPETPVVIMEYERLPPGGWRKAWWFDPSHARRFFYFPYLELWATAGGRLVKRFPSGRWLLSTDQDAWELVYSCRRDNQMSSLDQEVLPPRLRLALDLGRFVSDSAEAWTDGEPRDGGRTYEEAALAVAGLKLAMEGLQRSVLPDLRLQRCDAARRVDRGHSTQSAAAQAMGLDKSTWSKLISSRTD
ncbi:hypothetical protein ACFYYB_40860 [Streptomyces sp. NPDC002886]|uniref:hypothetical protein n=1 Tax=Streptomyces sp. NPDC002886 TaxID=3364667 RepID=UPI0036ADEA2F